MVNRELRSELQEMWIMKSAKHSAPKPEVKIANTSDMIRLTAMFTCVCLIIMGVGIAVLAVLA
ncbi:hypothetical protein [Pseudomonas sp. MONT-RG-20F-20-E-7-02]|uniref:hypothetical protein n=1 Tax=Pseudomonas sp. MONT-RG-20F-20-E-7-02 TaxID=2914979 RepID=UPI001F5774BB|nr:hypothetical protein [Pseudomonas sp. MONT-RG-20F-20-E-7-02]